MKRIDILTINVAIFSAAFIDKIMGINEIGRIISSFNWQDG